MLVFNIAHNFFQHVFNGNKTRSAAVFVKGDGNVLFAGAKFLQQGAYGLGFGHKKRLAHDRRYAGLVLALIKQAAQNVLGVQNTHDIVAGVLVHGNA